MKNIDGLGLDLCKMQGALFVASKTLRCGSAVFIRRFMNSEVAERIDKLTIAYASDNQTSLLNEIESAYNDHPYGNEKYSDEELYWIGYIYRYWSYCYEKPSKNIYKTIGAREMRNLYYPYHSLDPLTAIERILESKEKTMQDSIEEGVKILRKIIKNK